MSIHLDEVIERGLTVQKTGHILDPHGNEYREDGEACYLEDDELIQLLTEYIDYVEKYPETHEDDNYPACFEEWFNNDKGDE
jgi:hypothetical protein